MALTAALIQLGSMFLFPLLLWVILTRSLSVSWKFVGLGGLPWLTALPFIIGVPLGATLLLGQQPLVWAVSLSLTAGIVEETARYFYYQRNAALRDPANWRQAIVVGAGHGGVESIVLGMQLALGVVMLFFMRDQLPPEMRAIEPEASYFIIGTLSRLLIVVGHIGLTLMVWRAVSGKQLGWYVAAVVVHIGVDLIAFGQPILLPGHDWLGWAAVVGLFLSALWLIQNSRATAPKAAPATLVTPL